ncbi:MAG TPA: 1-deoxy-D-xylulose-5-phosphate reductoisomerase, partial [Candidatus Omnitrophica bacterium]|nr:1-deoxy-D-xylulose-5-phosphate reductoisomerase [Candidatus Omnitrophota bacterium]
MMKNIVILGSSGSVGKNTLDVITNHPDRFKVRAISAGSNVTLLSKQIEKVKPDIAVLADKTKFKQLKDRLRRTRTKILCGSDKLIDIVRDKSVDLVVVAISGSKALMPLLSAIDSGKNIALANKESLVMAGEIIMAKAKEK